MSGFDNDKLIKNHAKDHGDLARPLDHLSPDPGYKVGSSYIDRGMQCDAAPFEGCFLTSDQRARIVDQFHGRVNAAYTACLIAYAQLRVGELLAKEPSNTLLFEAILEVVGAVASVGLSKVFRAAQATAQRIVTEAQLDYQTATKATRAFAAGDLRSVDQVIKSINSTTKKHIGKPPAPDTSAPIAFLDALTDQAATTYQGIREDLPGLVTDDLQLLALNESFAGCHHTVSAYVDQIAGKLARFKSTHVGEIGTHEGWPKFTADVDPETQRQIGMRRGPFDGGYDTKVFIVDTLGVKRYALYRREFDRSRGTLNNEHMAAPMFLPPDKPDPDQAWSRQYVPMTDADFTLLEFVPEEFVDVAVKAHVAKWGHAPTERHDITPWSKKP